MNYWSSYEAKTFVNSLKKLKTAEEVDEAFKDFFDLGISNAVRHANGSEMEKAFLLPQYEKLKTRIITKGVDAAERPYLETAATANPPDITTLRRDAQIHYNIGELLRNWSSPATRAFNDAAEHLTLRESNSAEVLNKPMRAVVEAIAVQDGILKPNIMKRKRQDNPESWA
jgi:hypothetical protein